MSARRRGEPPLVCHPWLYRDETDRQRLSQQRGSDCRWGMILRLQCHRTEVVCEWKAEEAEGDAKCTRSVLPTTIGGAPIVTGYCVKRATLVADP